MRVLHTADWHLNDRLGSQHRNDDLFARLREIAGYLDVHDVDVLVVAGDVFSTYTRLAEVEAAWAVVFETFAPFLRSGGTVLALSGNHDSDPLFRLLRLATYLGNPFPVGRAADGSRHAHPGGRLYVAADPAVIRLDGRTGRDGRQGHPTQFALLPYPTSARYLRGETARYASVEEKNARLQQALVAQLERVQAEDIDGSVPAVLVAHLHVRGSELHSLYRLSERDDIVFEPGHLPTGWAYSALGHIHRPQRLPGADHVRYSGSIDRMDFGEAGDDKHVVLFEVTAQGAQIVAELPLDATPLYRVTVTHDGPDLDRAALAAAHPEALRDAARAIIDLTVRYDPDVVNRTVLVQQARELFPRAAWVHPVSTREPAAAATAPVAAGDPATVARDYVRQELGDEPDDEREATLALLDGLLDPTA